MVPKQELYEMVVEMSPEELFREELREAQAMSPEDKLLDGARLFDRSCVLMMAGIRHQFPMASEETIDGILIERLDFLQQIESGR